MNCSSSPEPKGGGGTEKILAIQFSSLGDALMMIPSLQAIRRRYPHSELHALAPESVGPLLQNEPSLTRLWLIPRVRGRALVKQSWPIIRALRAERFRRSVDFTGNDRGAIMSFLCGAKTRLGPLVKRGFMGRRFCYTHHVPPLIRPDCHETVRLLDMLSPWGMVTPPSSDISIRLYTNLESDVAAEKLLPGQAVLCHIGSGAPKKEWPVGHWATFFQMAKTAGHQLIFSAGNNPRELALLEELRKLVPDLIALPPTTSLATFLAVIKRATACVSNDTGPMHFAAGLGVPTIGLFGPTPPNRWGPIGPQCCVLQSPECTCDPSLHHCTSARSCMASIHPEKVFATLQTMLMAASPSSAR